MYSMLDIITGNLSNTEAGADTCNTENMSRYEIYVKTADQKGAGLHTGHVQIRLHDDRGNSSDIIKLSHLISSSFREGTTDTFLVPKSCQLEQVSKIELWKEGDGATADWFCELIYIMDKSNGRRRIFPIHRWIYPDLHYYILENYTCLPQDEPFPDQRRNVLCQLRDSYIICQRVHGISGVSVLPPMERFSNNYQDDLHHRIKNMALKSGWAKLTHWRILSLDDLLGFYEGLLFQKPKSVDFNSLTDDLAFGAQRLVGCNPTQIKLCTHIPSKFAVTDELVNEQLEGMTLNEAMSANRLFIIDYAILNDLPLEEGRTICAPIGLFFLSEDEAVMPVAIQLYQESSSDNPVFTPNDSTYTWQCAKLWFNLADASVHQSLTHLGLTHLLMEGIACAAHRQLAPQHPIFRLLAPHFLFLIEINWGAVTYLLKEGGWVSQAMTIGPNGLNKIIRRGVKTWRIDVEGTLPNAVKERGVLSPRVLKHYPYRDDAMLYYDVIHKYVAEVINIYYAEPSTIMDDHELQAWAEELARSCDEGGVGIQGIPNGGRFETVDDIVMVCTSIIFTCSVQHAAVNFSQYDQYGFPQNYPGFLNGKPPKDKAPLEEADLFEMHPGINETLRMISVSKILSEKGTNSLGDWEMRYQYDPRAVESEEEFKRNLGNIANIIERRNKVRPTIYQYHVLTPDGVPNSITI